MWERLRSLWTVPDLRKKILFTLAMLIVFRIVAHIPVPGVDPSKLAQALGQNGQLGQLFGLLDVFSGGSLKTFSIAALGVYPYITASIVMQLLIPIVPKLDQMYREGGEAGRLKVNQYTRYLTVPLALLQGLGQGTLFERLGAISQGQFNLFSAQSFVPTLATLLTLTAGTMFLVWLGELITENGIGNGISLIIFAGIVAGLPQLIGSSLVSSGGSSGGSANTIQIIEYAVASLILIAAMVYIYQSHRRVPVQYPTKRMVGRRVPVGGSQMTYIPIQVNSAGMIPLIFAQSLLIFPVIVAEYLSASSNSVVSNLAQNTQFWFNQSRWWYWILYFLLTVAFTFFYAKVVWDQQNIPENLQKQGAFIPGIRPGNPTSEYLNRVLWRITTFGAIFLGIVAAAPFAIGASQFISSAALLIVVGVALDTVRQYEAQMVMRNYSGFLR
jgi:preprotein translocase subunit SecY